MIQIIVDSTADIPVNVMKQYNIDMIPLLVHLDGKDYKDKTEITVEALYDALRSGNNPKTSLPHPQDVYTALEKAAKENMDILIITLSSKLSGTYQSIKLVSDQIKELYPLIRLEMIDSLGGSGVNALMAIQAAKMIEHGHSLDEIVDVLNDLSLYNEHIFTIDNLKNLIKSGRINKAEAFIGNMLRIKPILQVDQGEIKLLKKVHGLNKAISNLIEIVTDRIKEFPQQIIAINHADDYELALKVKELLTEKIGQFDCIIQKIGSALGTHIGIGGVGVFFFNKKPKIYYL